MSAWRAFLWTLRSTLFDKGAMVPAVVGVIAYCFFYPLPYLPETVRAVPVVVADYDGSSMSRKIERDLDATQAVRVEGTTTNVEDAIPRLQRGDIGGIVVVPPNFYRDVLRGTPDRRDRHGQRRLHRRGWRSARGRGAVVAEATAPALAGQLVRANVPTAAVLRAAHAGPIFVKQPLFNTVQGYESYVVPASMGLIVHQLLIIGICVVIGTWIERGRWAIAPTGRLSPGAFAGMLAGFWTLVMVAVLFWIGFVFWYHDLPRAANLGGAVAFAAIYALAVASVGVALGCWMRERERSLQIIAVASRSRCCSFPGLPFRSSPSTHRSCGFRICYRALRASRDSSSSNQMGATWREAWPQVSNLLLLAILYTAVAWWAASRRAPDRARSLPRPPERTGRRARQDDKITTTGASS